jgi:hypothetical protein
MLDQLVSKWDGPISVALYLSDSEANQLLLFASESDQIAKRTNIGFHIVYKEGVRQPTNRVLPFLIYLATLSGQLFTKYRTQCVNYRLRVSCRRRLSANVRTIRYTSSGNCRTNEYDV